MQKHLMGTYQTGIPAMLLIWESMFAGATTFNQDVISGWDTSKVTTMLNMFENATAFNQDISYKAATSNATTSAKWDTSNVTNMLTMFLNATAFNGGDILLSKWKTELVTTMRSMYQQGAKAFDQDISGWDVKKVTNHTDMFKDTTLADAKKPKFNP